MLTGITTLDQNLVLRPIRGQKEDMEEQKIGRASELNKQDIYTK